MSLADDIAHDLDLVDGTLEVTLVAADGRSLSVAGAWAGPLEHAPAEALPDDLRLESVWRRFHLPTARLDGVQPQPGDVLVEPTGVAWRVHRAEWAVLGTRWLVWTLKLR